MSCVLTDDASDYTLDYIRRLLEERRVGSRCAARIIGLLEAQPTVGQQAAGQLATAMELRKWTTIDGRPRNNG